MPEPPASVGDELAEAAGRLARSGMSNARREAIGLWAAMEGVKPGDVWLKRAGEAAPPVAERFRAVVERRSSGLPFAYAVGRVAFRALELTIDPRALIPRPETEGLVDLALEWGKRGGGSGKRGLAADVGTGCGCIALALATEGTFERVIGVERSPQAAALARENVALVQPRTPVEIRQGDLLDPLRRAGGDGGRGGRGEGERYRVIVSNPPYLTEDEYEALERSVKRFEPREALASGPDGLAATRVLFAGAAALLEPGGRLVLEIDERRGEAVRALACEYRWARVEIREDLFGRPRYALAFPREG